MSIKIKHYKNGNIERIEVRNKKGQFNNENGPAVQHWYENGQEKYRCYCINGQLHNENGPAYQTRFDNGQECYRKYNINGESMTEEEFLSNQKVKIICEGKTVEISRESAKALNLI